MFHRPDALRRLLIRHIRITLIFSACSAATFGVTNYTFITLGPTPDQPNALVAPTSLNNAGQVVGFEYVSNPNDQTLVLWTNGVASVVPMPSRYQLAAPFQSGLAMPAINAAGQILAPAIETASGSQVGIIFTGGSYTLIAAAPNSCGSNTTNVIGINAAGHVVGTTSGGSCTVFWIWNNGSFTTFVPPVSTHFILAGINDADHVFGIRCANVPVQEGCESGPIFELQSGQTPVSYQLPANGISAPNNRDQVTGFVLAGPGSDSIFWLSPTSSVGIPLSGPLAEQSCCYTNPNNAGFVVFKTPAAGGYAIMREGNNLGPLAGLFSTVASPVALNDGMQFLAGAQLFSPEPGSCALDVTSQIAVTAGPPIHNPTTGRYQQKVTLTNQGAALSAPVSLQLDNLSPHVAVYGLSGTTTCQTPAGVPYVYLPSSFGPAGSQVAIDIEFIDSAAAGLGWTPQILAGAGGR